MIVDGYSGAGGWDEGARLAGVGPVVGIDNWFDACRTGKAAGHARICADVSTYPTAPFIGRVQGVIQSPPCTPFSAAGKQLGLLDQARVHALVDRMAAGDDRWHDMTWEDHRSHHAAQPVRWIRDLRPEWVCLEQVPEVLPLWEHVGRVFHGWGYHVWTGKLCAADYGVPQTRTRAVLFASRVRRVYQPVPTHYDPRQGHGLFGGAWVTMSDALGWPGDDVLQSRRDSPKWVEQHGERENRTASSPTPTITGEAHRWKIRTAINSQMGDGSQRRYERTTDRPAPTIVASAGRWKIVAGEYMRPIEISEAAVLQGFRSDYPWRGTKTSKHQQIGNAVPPPLAAVVIQAATGVAQPALEMAA